MNSFGASFQRALQATLRDRAALSTMVIAVVLYSFYYPAAYRHQIAAHLPIVVADLDHSASSRALIRKHNTVRAVYVTAQTGSLDAARQEIRKYSALGMLVIPRGFEREMRRGTAGEVALLTNGADLLRSGIVANGVSEAVGSFVAEEAPQQAKQSIPRVVAPIQLVQRPLFNTREGYGSSIVPGVAILIIQQSLLLGIVLLAATRRENSGRFCRSGTELLGIGGAFSLIGLMNILYFVGFSFWLQDFPRGGNFWGFIVTAAVYIAAVVAFSLFVASFFAVRERGFQVILPTALVLFFLSNLTWPVQATPAAIVWCAKLIPSTPGINAMVKLNEMGAQFTEIAPELGNLTLLLMLYGALAAWRYGALRMRASDGTRIQTASRRSKTFR